MSQQAIHRRKVRRRGYRAGRRAYTVVASNDNKRFRAVVTLMAVVAAGVTAVFVVLWAVGVFPGYFSGTLLYHELREHWGW